MTRDFRTSIPLKKEYFELIKSGEKNLHIDKDDYSMLWEGDLIRFMKGYDPENGSIIKEISKVERKCVDHISFIEMLRAEVDVKWLLKYIDDPGQILSLVWIREPLKEASEEDE